MSAATLEPERTPKSVKDPNSKSAVRNFFENGECPENDKHKCRTCFREVMSKPSTSNLIAHLKNRHPEQYNEFKRLQQLKKTQQKQKLSRNLTDIPPSINLGDSAKCLLIDVVNEFPQLRDRKTCDLSSRERRNYAWSRISKALDQETVCSPTSSASHQTSERCSGQTSGIDDVDCNGNENPQILDTAPSGSLRGVPSLATSIDSMSAGCENPPVDSSVSAVVSAVKNLKKHLMEHQASINQYIFTKHDQDDEEYFFAMSVAYRLRKMTPQNKALAQSEILYRLLRVEQEFKSTSN